jgi:tetratricopeptide (TPR) repeat protein
MWLSAIVLVTAVALIAWLAIWMTSQKPVAHIQQLIQQHRYADAVAEAEARPDGDSAAPLHHGEALKLLGRFEEAIAAYRRSSDPAAREGIALSLAHLGRDFDTARALMEEQIAKHPQIQEFQALALAFVLLRSGDRDAALRLFDDNRVLLETRFRDDYTDPDPLLAETLVMYAALAEAAGDSTRAAALREQAAQWAPGSVWAESGTSGKA